MKQLLTIAGSDSSGGAGIQADIKTFSAHGCYAMSVITAVTAQNTLGVNAVQDIDPEIIAAQLDAIFQDIRVDAVKVGMVSRTESIHVIADRLRRYQPCHIVVDPVMVSKSGYNLLQPDAVEALKEKLIPLASMLTPNIPEAEIIAGMKINMPSDMELAAEKVAALGAKSVLVKGGHLEGAADDLLYDGQEMIWYAGHRIESKNTHGTGCTISSAIASNLAHGMTPAEAVKAAKVYITMAISHAVELGHGHGPTNHFYQLWKKAGISNAEE